MAKMKAVRVLMEDRNIEILTRLHRGAKAEYEALVKDMVSLDAGKIPTVEDFNAFMGVVADDVDTFLFGKLRYFRPEVVVDKSFRKLEYNPLTRKVLHLGYNQETIAPAFAHEYVHSLQIPYALDKHSLRTRPLGRWDSRLAIEGFALGIEKEIGREWARKKENLRYLFRPAMQVEDKLKGSYVRLRALLRGGEIPDNEELKYAYYHGMAAMLIAEDKHGMEAYREIFRAERPYEKLVEILLE